MTTETTETTETPLPPKHLFVLGFPDQAHAERAVAGLKSLQRDHFVEVRDHAIITKSAEGKLHIAENADADHTAKHGAVTGGLAGAFVAVLSGPIGIGAVVVGAGIGAVVTALHDTGFKSGDMKEVGSLMEAGRSLLLVAVRPEDSIKMRDAIGDLPELKAADRHWEAEVAGDSKNVLQDAITQFKAQQAAAAPTEGAATEAPAEG